ncbi:hypothetical protein [Sphaerobacter sp.]|uniref:hypothetical protein n=1 Tax=Sphaerobacter sp. TaxID=2099654 RepID=UPI0025E46BB4|nr:hypothetical protein [Sphaerobacter sp.]
MRDQATAGVEGSTGVVQQPLEDVRQEAERILVSAEERGIVLRILGGVAVLMHSPSAEHRALQRAYGDLDFITLGSDRAELPSLFVELGYTPDAEFNTLHGHQRLYFWDSANQRQVDVFVDTLRMSHTLDLRQRLHLERRTIPLADLLLTKLQIYEINDKDVRDIIALLRDHPLGSGDEEMFNLDRLLAILTADWGFYRTTVKNIAVVREALSANGLADDADIASRLDELERAIEAAPKTRAWKLRALIGDRKPWYELPEEVRRD